MKILTVIFGAILVICGVVCMFSPAETFMATGYWLAILLLVYGIIGIINVIRKFSSPITLFASIPAVIIGAIALFRPGSAQQFDALILYLVAAWFVVRGIVDFVVAIRTRFFTGGWVWRLIFGILEVIVGAYSFAHPQVAAIAIGVLVGIYMIEVGISMIVIAATARNIENVADYVGQAVRDVENKIFPADPKAAAAGGGFADEAAKAADDAAEAVDDVAKAPENDNEEN